MFSRAALTLLLCVLTAATAWAENVNYIDADGTQQSVNATVVTTSMAGTTAANFYDSNGWFYVKENVTLDGGAFSAGDKAQNIILGDGATLTVSGGRFLFYSAPSVNIYCQSGGTGKLVVSGPLYSGAIFKIPSGKTLTIYGGTVEVTNTSTGGISGLDGNLVMNGGTAKFTSNGYAINGDGTHGGIMSCSWTGSTTNITGCLFDGSIQSASGYTTDQCGGFVGWRNATINITNSLMIADLSTIGVGTGDYPSATFVRNGVSSITNSYYDTALGTAQGKQRHSITAGEYVTVAPGGTAYPYSVSGITAYGLTPDPSPTGEGSFSPGLKYGGVLYAGEGDQVSLTLGNTLPICYAFSDYNVSPDEATLTPNGSEQGARMINLDLGDSETTGINLIPATSAKDEGSEYYDLQGRKVTMPSQKGLYMMNGRKVVVK